MAIEDDFPNLKTDGHRVTSKPDGGYNCIGWAAGEDDRWWDVATGYFWPDEAPRDDSIAALVSVYGTIGYQVCDDGGLEPGYEKVAVYGDRSGWTHAARQLDDGKWTSKLGPNEDIEHGSPAGVADTEYGKVVHFMKRPKPSPGAAS